MCTLDALLESAQTKQCSIYDMIHTYCLFLHDIWSTASTRTLPHAYHMSISFQHVLMPT